MGASHFLNKIQNRSRTVMVDLFARRSYHLVGTTPFISFTFDDFPKSAYLIGGKILRKYGLTGTYYISLGLMNKKTDTGEIADIEIIKNVLSEGNELGCHTYSHPDPWKTTTDIFESSIIENQQVLSSILPGINFNTFAYPNGVATPQIKKIASKYFICCRGGKQSFNNGKMDFNYLNAYFIDKRKKINISSVKETINANCREKGWLIIVTHGVDNYQSSYGCAPDYFEEIVRYSIKSGAIILPVMKTIDELERLNSIVPKIKINSLVE